MQDSSTNPFIPQESQEIRHKTETLHTPLGRAVKLALIITGALLVISIAALVYLVPRTSAEDSEARIDLGNVLQPPEKIAKLLPVSSTLGFSLKYDNHLFTSMAETGDTLGTDGKVAEAGSTYTDNDLRTERNYETVRIRPTQSADATHTATTNPPELEISTDITAKTLKDNETKPDYKDLSKINLFIQLSTDKKLAERNPEDGTSAVVSIEASKAVSQTIAGVQYQKVRFTTKNENYRIVTEKYEDCYYTIQSTVPYAACITDVRPQNTSAAALDEKLLESLAYRQPVEAEDTDDTTKVEANVETAQGEPVEAPLEAKKPEYNTNPESLKAIAKSQPSTVRVGTLYCADLALKLESGDTALTLDDACANETASGTIISKDGYILTAGHTVRLSPKQAVSGYINMGESQEDMLGRLQRVLDYLRKAKLIEQSDAEYLKTGAQIGDQEALAKIENISSIIPDNFVTAVKEEYTYAAQPTDKPIVVDKKTGQKPVFAYSDSVVSAKYVASAYDTVKYSRTKFDSVPPVTDTGLIKIEGDFQNVPLVATDMKANDKLTLLGFPAYTDNTLLLDKMLNQPIVTSVKVEQTYDKNDQQIVQADSPVVPGNDGSGVYDQAAQLVGFGTFGLPYCPDNQCFASGTIRSVGEITAVIEKQNLKLGDLSQASVVWRDAVDQYFKGNYAAAKAGFASAGKQYDFNVWAQPLEQLAKSKQGSASDTSLYNQIVGILIGAVVVMTIVTILLTVVMVLHKKRLDRLRVGHYGADIPVSYPSAPAQQYPPQQPYIQQAPTQQWGQQQPYQPQQQPIPPQQPQPQPYQAPQPQAPAQQPQQPQAGPVAPGENPFNQQ